jgi:hypothetical protein
MERSRSRIKPKTRISSAGASSNRIQDDSDFASSIERHRVTNCNEAQDGQQGWGTVRAGQHVEFTVDREQGELQKSAVTTMSNPREFSWSGTA